MSMTPQIDTEARSFGRRFEQPTGRFGNDHIVNEPLLPAYEVPAVEASEAREVLATPGSAFEKRGGKIAVADTVALPRLETL